MWNQQSQCLETGVNTLHTSPFVRVCNFPPQFSFPLSIVHHFDFKPVTIQKGKEKNEVLCEETKCRNADMKLTSSVTCNRHPRRARPPRKLYVCRQFGYKMTFSLTSEERRANNSTLLLFPNEILLEARRFAAIHGKQATECLTSTAPKSAGNSCL